MDNIKNKIVNFVEPDVPKEIPHLPEGSFCPNKEKGKKAKRKNNEREGRKSKNKLTKKDDIIELKASQDTNVSSQSQKSKKYLSQPPKRIRHRDRMIWLQERRESGIWVNCDECKNWGYLPNTHDPLELPSKWYCSMNPDLKYAKCHGKEKKLDVADEEDLIHNEYSCGSLVWAKMSGFPWWPAMVDDCPDVEQYYWLDGFSDIPTYYNVVFFDSENVTRAWISPDCLKPFHSIVMQSNVPNKYKTRLHVAKNQAKDAKALQLIERLKKYSFVSRFNGSINTPKIPTKREKRIAKQKYFKNIQDFLSSSSSGSSRRSSLNSDLSQILESDTQDNFVATSQKDISQNSQTVTGPLEGNKELHQNKDTHELNGQPSFQPSPDLLSSQNSSFLTPSTPSIGIAVKSPKEINKTFMAPVVKKPMTDNNLLDSEDISVQKRKTVRMILDSVNTEDEIIRSDQAVCEESTMTMPSDSKSLQGSQSTLAELENFNNVLGDQLPNLDFTESDFDLMKNTAVVPSTSEEVNNLEFNNSQNLSSQNSDDFDF